MNKEELGERIARERINKGMSQKTLADTIGVSRGYIAQIERGREPSEEILVKLITILGIPITELVDFEKLKVENEALANLMEIITPSMQFMSDTLQPEEMLELVRQQQESEALVDKFISASANLPMPVGPNGWEKLSKGDRKLVQEIINRLLKTSRYGEGVENG